MKLSLPMTNTIHQNVMERLNIKMKLKGCQWEWDMLLHCTPVIAANFLPWPPAFCPYDPFFIFICHLLFISPLLYIFSYHSLFKHY